MGSMTATEERPPLPAGPLSVADLEAFPDDGHRYELIDGVLVVSPAPIRVHQRAVGRLYRALDDAVPAGHEVFVAPFAVHPEPGSTPAQRTELQPDILVAADADLTDKDLAGVPLLAVEVLSQSTQLFDRNLKKATYERIGTPHFWLVDPLVPEILAFTLDGEGQYALAAHATADEVLRLELPFPVELRPSDLVRRRG